MKPLFRTIKYTLAGSLSAILLFAGDSTAEQTYEGLWVGHASLQYVNEVSIPLDENNIPIAPVPTEPTPTHDEAQIRLILHVNGAGQVNLLKDVALLRQDSDAPGSNVLASESSFVLVTDERLYSQFPDQEALRIASAVFDFGDPKATDALDVIVEVIASNVAVSVNAKNLDAQNSDGDLRTAESDAEALAISEADNLTGAMDVAESFRVFIADNLSPAQVDELVTAGTNTVPNPVDALEQTADDLVVASFYNDMRAAHLFDDLKMILVSSTNDTAKTTELHNLISRYADVDNEYQRFITGRSFGDLIEAAAQKAAEISMLSNATLENVTSGVDGLSVVVEARGDAALIQNSIYNDTAPTDAVNMVLDAVINSAYTSTSQVEVIIAAEAERAGLDQLKEQPRYVLQTQAPTADYTEFIRSESFPGSIATAAEAAAIGAVRDAVSDQFHTEDSLYRAAKLEAVNALQTIYAEAARTQQTELPMDGVFASDLHATIFLPASHPTNPFRHRRHPDHTRGYDIHRIVDLTFDGETTNQLERVSIGVDQISGIYREEVFGLHKPLGSQPETNPVGLIVQGRFELNRISHIDTLNSL